MIVIKRFLLGLLLLVLLFVCFMVWHTFYFKASCWQDQPHILCTATSDEEIKSLLSREINNQVFVQGGDFEYGDVVNKTGSDDDKPIIPVTLTSYSISKYETTIQDFIVYLQDSGNANRYTPYQKNSDGLISLSNSINSPYYYKKPIRVPEWQEAYNYCAWLADKTDIPFALPSETQWEYAARSRGKPVHFATYREDFVLLEDKYGGNKDKDWHYERIEFGIEYPPNGDAYMSSAFKRPVGSYPPNELGIHDMTGNAGEWVQDWYDETYYSKLLEQVHKGKQIINPLGPDEPVTWSKGEKPVAKKSVRDWGGVGGYLAEHAGWAVVYARGGVMETSERIGFRCAVNQDSPLAP